MTAVKYAASRGYLIRLCCRPEPDDKWSYLLTELSPS
jgi:hypothetical protein